MAEKKDRSTVKGNPRNIPKVSNKNQEEKETEEVVGVEAVEELDTPRDDLTKVISTLPVVRASKDIDIMSTKLFTEQLMKDAKALVESGILPAAIDSAEKAIAVMQKGRELGFPAMASFEHIVVINGKPSLDGVAMMTKLKQGGVSWKTIHDYDPVYKVDDVRWYKSELVAEKKPLPEKPIDSDTIIEFYRSGDKGRELVEEGKFTYKEAIAADLIKKDVWIKYTRVMMWWRAFSLGARRIGGDLIMGMHTPEELDPSGTVYLDQDGRVKSIKNK